jgi:hypothetical protein
MTTAVIKNVACLAVVPIAGNRNEATYLERAPRNSKSVTLTPSLHDLRASLSDKLSHQLGAKDDKTCTGRSARLRRLQHRRITPLTLAAMGASEDMGVILC